MDINHFHFAHPMWLWAGMIIPLVWILFFLYYQRNRPIHQLETFIDKHLLPYLLVNGSGKEASLWKTLLLWSVVWSCLTLAIAGPRWNFQEIETYSRDQSLVILLDLSQSMDAKDIKPSRLVRARQKIEDLLNLTKGVKIGLVAFAADPHMITPLTDDVDTIRYLLPSLDTDLVFVQGSRLSPALDMASNLLNAEPGNNKAIMLISDGGFEDASAITTAKKLAEKGIVIHTMGVGTVEGAPFQDSEGNFVKSNDSLVLSKLEIEKMREISNVGKGRYLEAHFSDHAESVVLNELEKRAEAQKDMKHKTRFWEEHFYLLVFPLLPVVLLWFRRGYLFPIFLLLLTPSLELGAFEIGDYFKNSEELGKKALDESDYETAIERLQDPYRKGVVHYRAGNFTEAEALFRESSRPEVAANTAYNLGNALVQQQKLKEAVTAYEEVLKRWPDHTKARENLEIVKKMLEEQDQDNQQSDESDQQDQNDENNQNESNEEGSNQNQDSKDSDKQDQDQGSKDSDDKNQNNDNNQDESNEQNRDQNQDTKDSDTQDQNQDSKDSDEKEQNNQENQEPEDQNTENDDPQDQGNDSPTPANEEDQNDQSDREAKLGKSQEDQDADQWLNRISNEPKGFLKNKFYIESQRNGTKEAIEPW